MCVYSVCDFIINSFMLCCCCAFVGTHRLMVLKLSLLELWLCNTFLSLFLCILCICIVCILLRAANGINKRWFHFKLWGARFTAELWALGLHAEVCGLYWVHIIGNWFWCLLTSGLLFCSANSVWSCNWLMHVNGWFIILFCKRRVMLCADSLHACRLDARVDWTQPIQGTSDWAAGRRASGRHGTCSRQATGSNQANEKAVVCLGIVSFYLTYSIFRLMKIW